MLRIINLALVLVAVAAYAETKVAPKSGGPIHQTIEDRGAKYQVTVEPEEQKIEVVREGPAPTVPPELRLRIHREPEPPIDVRLSAMQPPKDSSPLHYSGRIDKWNQSYIGLELQFSFDKKTWSRLGRIFR